MANTKIKTKAKKFLFGTAIAGMTFGGGFGLAKHQSNTEKEMQKKEIVSKVQNNFDAQINTNRDKLSEINREKSHLHATAGKIISDMINQQNDTVNKQISALEAKILKSFSSKEIKQIKEELDSCFYGEYPGVIDLWPILAVDEKVNLAYDIAGEYNTQNKPFIYPELGAKRYKFRQEYDSLYNNFIGNTSTEQEFIKSFTVRASADSAKFYSYIMQDFADYYNSLENSIRYWDEDALIERARIGEIENLNKEIKQGQIPNFGLIGFKKHKAELDKICARFQELEKEEKQLQQISNLKNTIMADLSR